MKIHQLVHTLSYGDAISSEVLALQRCFGQKGASSAIYALNIHPKLKNFGQSIEQFVPAPGSEVILHYSLGSPLNDLYRSLNSTTRTLIYHNLTPATWFKGVHARIVQDIEQGLRELPQLCDISDRLIADSTFNAAELKSLGFEAMVLNLPVDPRRWEVAPNPGIRSLVRSQAGPHILHVGRMAPNKCLEDVIKIFFFLQRQHNPSSRLWLVGIDTDTEIYSYSLKRLVYELKLEESVNFVGCFSDSEVRALYEACDLYLCMSEHEGFCLPVLEAMHFGMPVIAYDSSALRDTVGKGGILVKEKRYAEVAQLIWKISKEAPLRQILVAAGKERVRELSFENFAQRVMDIFGAHQAPQRAIR